MCLRLQKTKFKLQNKLDHVNAENLQILRKMQEQHKNVVEPLIEQVKLKEVECQQLKEVNKTISTNIKKIQAILRSPLLSQMFQKENAIYMTK